MRPVARAAVVALALCAGLVRSARGVQDEQPAQAAPEQQQEQPSQVDPRLYTLFEGALVDTKNGAPFAETAGYKKLMYSIASYKPEDVAQRAQPFLDHAAVLRDPDAFRGQFMRARGLVPYVEAVRLEGEIFGAKDVYRGVVAAADGTEGVVFDMLEAPPMFELLRDIVDVEGVLYRTVRYENKKGELVEAPYMIARSVVVLDPDDLEHVGPRAPFKVVLIGAALAFLVARLLIYWFQRKKELALAAQQREPGLRKPRGRPRKGRPSRPPTST